MIKSLVLTGMFKIPVSNEQIYVDGKKLALKDIPYIRYRFENYGEEEVNYIKECIQKFKYSVHIADITVKDGCAQTCDALDETFNNEDINLFMFAIIKLTPGMTSGEISENLRDNLEQLSKREITKYVLKDDMFNSVVCRVDEYDAVRRLLMKITGLKSDKFSLCGSPFEPGNGCLTASTVRQLQTYKEADIEIPLVPEGHENSGSCGCTRYEVVSCDLIMKEATVAKKSNGEPKEKTVKKKIGLPMFGV